jgi:hypothetical protein
MKLHDIGVAVLLCTAPAWVQAHDDGPDAGKTAAKANADLEQAWRDGYLPHRDSEYPPTAASKARNRQRHALSHPGDPAANVPATTGD